MGTGVTVAAALIAWRFWGVDGACWAAAIAALLGILARIGFRVTEQVAADTALEKMLAMVQDQTREIIDLRRDMRERGRS